MDVRFHHPFTLLNCGPSGCGKTQWTKKLLESGDIMINGFPDRIVWFYGEYQPAHDEISTSYFAQLILLFAQQ